MANRPLQVGRRSFASAWCPRCQIGVWGLVGTDLTFELGGRGGAEGEGEGDWVVELILHPCCYLDRDVLAALDTLAGGEGVPDA